MKITIVIQIQAVMKIIAAILTLAIILLIQQAKMVIKKRKSNLSILT
jgi:hypothetical protein